MVLTVGQAFRVDRPQALTVPYAPMARALGNLLAFPAQAVLPAVSPFFARRTAMRGTMGQVAEAAAAVGGCGGFLDTVVGLFGSSCAERQARASNRAAKYARDAAVAEAQANLEIAREMSRMAEVEAATAIQLSGSRSKTAVIMAGVVGGVVVVALGIKLMRSP